MTEDEFLEKHGRLVYNLALRLVGNPADAEDLAQEALLRALKALPRFREEASASTWVYRITVNAWKNRVRSEKRRGFWRMLPLGAVLRDEDEGAEPAAEEPPLDAGLQSRETADAVHKALMELDAESREVVVLRDMEGLPYERIAEALEVPVGTVKSRLSRARERLKVRLKTLTSAEKP